MFTPETQSRLPDWVIAILTAGGMFIGGVLYIGRLPWIQREQQRQLRRIEQKLDSVIETLGRNGMFPRRGNNDD